jgi:hypothetical protein
VGASRTIPRNMMSNYNPITGEEDPKTLENIFVLCHQCIMDNIIVNAPRSYISLLNYNKHKTAWYNTQIKIKMDLEADKLVLMDNIINMKHNMEILRSEDNRINQEIIDLQNNLSLDREKCNKLKSTQTIHYNICHNITEDAKRMREYVKSITNKCKINLIQTQDRIGKLYEDILIKNRENTEELETQFTMEISSNAPCQICKNGKLSIYLDPCGHCICKRCKEGVINSGSQCPYCRGDISMYKPLYLGF